MGSDRESGGADEVEQGEQRRDEQEWEEAGTYGQRWSEKDGAWIPYHHPTRLQMLGVIQELLPAGKASGWTPQDEGGMLAGMTSRTLGLAVEGRTGWNMSDLEDKDMQALFSGCAQEAVRARIDEETHGMRQRKHELSDLEARAEREEAMLQASEREPEEIGVEEPKPEAGGERESGSGTEDQDQVILLVATNLRAQAEFNPRAFHGVVAAPDASVYRRRKSPVTGLPLPQQRGGRE